MTESVEIADRRSPGPGSATKSVNADGVGKGNRRKACDECKQQKVRARKAINTGHEPEMFFCM